MTMMVLAFASVSKNKLTVAVEIALSRVTRKLKEEKDKAKELYETPYKRTWWGKVHKEELNAKLADCGLSAGIYANAKSVLENIKVLCAATLEDKVLLSDYGLHMIQHYGGDLSDTPTLH